MSDKSKYLTVRLDDEMEKALKQRMDYEQIYKLFLLPQENQPHFGGYKKPYFFLLKKTKEREYKILKRRFLKKSVISRVFTVFILQFSPHSSYHHVITAVITT